MLSEEVIKNLYQTVLESYAEEHLKKLPVLISRESSIYSNVKSFGLALEYDSATIKADMDNAVKIKLDKSISTIKEDGTQLKYIDNHRQTPEICIDAVRQNPYALLYVKNQTSEICLEAVKKDPSALMFVKDNTPGTMVSCVVEAYKNEYPKIAHVSHETAKQIINLNYETNIERYINSEKYEIVPLNEIRKQYKSMGLALEKSGDIENIDIDEFNRLNKIVNGLNECSVKASRNEVATFSKSLELLP